MTIIYLQPATTRHRHLPLCDTVIRYNYLMKEEITFSIQNFPSFAIADAIIFAEFLFSLTMTACIKELFTFVLYYYYYVALYCVALCLLH